MSHHTHLQQAPGIFGRGPRSKPWLAPPRCSVALALLTPRCTIRQLQRKHRVGRTLNYRVSALACTLECGCGLHWVTQVLHRAIPTKAFTPFIASSISVGFETLSLQNGREQSCQSAVDGLLVGEEEACQRTQLQCAATAFRGRTRAVEVPRRRVQPEAQVALVA